MARRTQVVWTGTEQVKVGIRQYGDAVHTAVANIAEYWAAVFENYAKENAPWTDRTSNARQGLHAFVEELSRKTVELYLMHGVEYGVYLELGFAGRYAIIWPTIERHLPQIRKMLKETFG